MHVIQELPEGYEEKLKIDLQNDKKTMLIINISANVAMVLMLVLMHFIVPFTSYIDLEGSLLIYFLKIFLILAAYGAYLILHEATHGIVMKLFGAKEVKFGFTGLYAYAGSSADYFDKLSYYCVALAPLTVWSIILFVICLIVPGSWVWLPYFVQAGNIAGSFGDLYVFARLLKMKDIFVRDTGVNMSVFGK